MAQENDDRKPDKMDRKDDQLRVLCPRRGNDFSWREDEPESTSRLPRCVGTPCVVGGRCVLARRTAIFQVAARSPVAEGTLPCCTRRTHVCSPSDSHLEFDDSTVSSGSFLEHSGVCLHGRSVVWPWRTNGSNAHRNRTASPGNQQGSEAQDQREEGTEPTTARTVPLTRSGSTSG